MGTGKTQTRLVGIDKLKGELHEKLPISEVAERMCAVDLVQAGEQYKGLCPLHDERTPSFYVRDGKGVYKCWGCDQGGDAIDLVQKVRHVDFIEALYVMAEEAGIDITEYERPMTEEEKQAERLRARCEEWLDSLPVQKDRQAAMNAKFGVKRGDSKPRKNIDLPDYHFKGTVFPLRTIGGRLVGWKTRTRDKKMFATPSTFPIHEDTLYGIDQARETIRETGRVIVVEGEWDTESMHNAGWTETVGIGGSKFTDEQMAILQGLHIKRATFLLDGDKPGQDASRRIAERWWQGDMRCYIASLPLGVDPEDYLATGVGLVNMGVVLAEARWALEWALFDEWSRRGRSMSEKLEYLEWVQETFGAQLRPAEEAVVMQDIARWMELPEAQVLDFSRLTKSKLQAVDSERIVLGRCMRDQAYYRDRRHYLDADDFYMVRHQRMWQVLEGLLVEDMDFEPAAIRQRAIGAGVDEEYIDTLFDTGEGNLAYHEEQIADLAVRRDARQQADRFRDRIADVSVDSTASIGDLTRRITNKALGRRGVPTIVEQVDGAMDTLHERMRNPSAVHGLSLGGQFPMLNQRLQGIQHRRFVLVLALSGVGKTTITLQWVTNFAVANSIPTDFISLEMDEDEMLFKMASHISGVEAEKITSGALEESESKLVEQAMARIRKSPLRLFAPDDITPTDFVLYARESVMEHRTEVFVLDYAQLISPDPASVSKKTYEQLKEFGRMAKMQVARGMNTAVICPAQLTRVSKDSDRPTKEDIGDSYDLARTADVVLIMKDNEGSDTIDFWIDKNRQGSGGHLLAVEYNKAEQTFYEHGGNKQPDYRLM